MSPWCPPIAPTSWWRFIRRSKTLRRWILAKAEFSSCATLAACLWTKSRMCCASLPSPSRATGGLRKCGFAVKSPPLPNVQAERWRPIDDLFQSALDRPPEELRTFLDSACAGDAELRREVESLLALVGSSDLTSPAFEEAMAAL